MFVPAPRPLVLSRLLRAVLAAWVCVASTFCEVAHAHAGEACGTAAAIDPAGEPGEHHWHLSVLGLDSGTLPADPCGSDADDETGVTVGLACGSPAASAEADTAPALPPATLSPQLPPPPPTPTAVVAVAHHGPPSRLCAKAAHARSGVRLA